MHREINSGARERATFENKAEKFRHFRRSFVHPLMIDLSDGTQGTNTSFISGKERILNEVKQESRDSKRPERGKKQPLLLL